jgi:translation initiation factor IF-3
MSSREALEKAYEEGLDLVEISDASDPPVCRIMNYDKFRYEQSKKQAEARKRQTVVEVKEVKFRPKTEEHDLNFKIKNIKKFLANKNKVKMRHSVKRQQLYSSPQWRGGKWSCLSPPRVDDHKINFQSSTGPLDFSDYRRNTRRRSVSEADSS